jgi:hypothetical protein
MKKLLMFMLAISLLTACNNNPFGGKDNKVTKQDKDGQDDKDDKDDDADKKGDKDDDIEGGVTESNWTRSQRNKWLDQCIEASGNNPKAREVCSCVLEKLEKKYPDSKDADNASEAEGTRLAKECMAGTVTGGDEDNNDDGRGKVKQDDDDTDNGGTEGWTSLQRKQFIRGCATTAKQAQGFTTEQANSYCDCMTKKIERKYSFQEAGRLTTADLSTQEWQNAAIDCRNSIDY